MAGEVDLELHGQQESGALWQKRDGNLGTREIFFRVDLER
jgi:hypothetical protein